MSRYVAELIGTFFLVFTIGCTVILGSPGVIPPLAIGAVLMVMVYAGGHLSGAHYNPAVTVAVWLRGKCALKDVVPYWIAQLLGAALATQVVLRLSGGTTAPAFHPAALPAFLAEFLFTFALAYVVLNVATAKATAGNSYFGLAIGMTVMAGAFAVGGISGGAFNPAVAVALGLFRILPWTNLGTYLVAEIAAAVVAALVFRFLHPDDR